MNTKVLIKLSLIISKMGIAQDLMNIEASSNEELGKVLIALVLSNIYKAENEVYEMIAEYKKITIDEAKEANIIEIIKELTNSEYFKSFLPQS